MAPNSDEGDGPPFDLKALVKANQRGWQDFWHYRDKPLRELGAATTLLEAYGLKVENLRSRPDGEDPPVRAQSMAVGQVSKSPNWFIAGRLSDR